MIDRSIACHSNTAMRGAAGEIGFAPGDFTGSLKRPAQASLERGTRQLRCPASLGCGPRFDVGLEAACAFGDSRARAHQEAVSDGSQPAFSNGAAVLQRGTASD